MADDKATKVALRTVPTFADVPDYLLEVPSLLAGFPPVTRRTTEIWGIPCQ
jgi:hypothetical protein